MTELTRPPLTPAELTALMEAYLFVALEPIVAVETAKILGLPTAEVEEALEQLRKSYAVRNEGGLQIVRIVGGYQMCTRSDLAEHIARLLATPASKSRLSKPALETLAVIAYQQPVTTAEVEAVRGVSVDGVVKTLLERKLIKEDGRKQVPGRPILYATTPDFLHYFGLNSLEDLPPLEDIIVPESEADKKEERVALEAVGLEEVAVES